jgi:NADH-ubiquinone oxidoreductase chain 4L
MTLSYSLIVIGILGYIYNKKNIILLLINMEIILLGIILNILIYSNNFNDNIGLL